MPDYKYCDLNVKAGVIGLQENAYFHLYNPLYNVVCRLLIIIVDHSKCSNVYQCQSAITITIITNLLLFQCIGMIIG